jgi:hypothetical protein
MDRPPPQGPHLDSIFERSSPDEYEMNSWLVENFGESLKENADAFIFPIAADIQENFLIVLYPQSPTQRIISQLGMKGLPVDAEREVDQICQTNGVELGLNISGSDESAIQSLIHLLHIPVEESESRAFHGGKTSLQKWADIGVWKVAVIQGRSNNVQTSCRPDADPIIQIGAPEFQNVRPDDPQDFAESRHMEKMMIVGIESKSPEPIDGSSRGQLNSLLF